MRAPRQRRLPVAGAETPTRVTPEAQGPARRELHERPPDRRKLFLDVGRLTRGLPVVLLAVAGPTGGCYLSHGRPDAGPMDAGRDARPPIRRDVGPPPDTGPEPLCGAWGFEERFVVDLPPPGVPADASLICVEPDDAVSPDAARVTLELDAADASVAHATITIPPSLHGEVVGTPTVRIADPGFGIWFDASLGPVTAEGDVFRFDVTFPRELTMITVDSFDGRAVFEVRFELDCADGTRKVVLAETIVHVCLEDDWTTTFASSGEECRTCAIIAEMAPTPIIPSEQPDRIPLQQGMHLELRAVGRFENAVVLWAEHDAGDDARYEWHATAGRLHPVADDVAVWEVDLDAAPLAAAQVVVESEDAAAVATFRRGGGM